MITCDLFQTASEYQKQQAPMCDPNPHEPLPCGEAHLVFKACDAEGSQDMGPMGTLTAFEFCGMLHRYQPQVTRVGLNEYANSG